jgi:integrase
LGYPHRAQRWHHHWERFSRKFVAAVVLARASLGTSAVPTIRLHDLRHTDATLLLAAGIPVKVVSERLGHASATITLGIYAHVMPGMQAQAAAKFGALMAGGAS